MNAVLDWNTIAAVAERFHGAVRTRLTDHLHAIDDLNAQQKELCATYLFDVDPNDLFAVAFAEVVGRPVDARMGSDLAAYDIAWGLARRRGFSQSWSLGR